MGTAIFAALGRGDPKLLDDPILIEGLTTG